MKIKIIYSKGNLKKYKILKGKGLLYLKEYDSKGNTIHIKDYINNYEEYYNPSKNELTFRQKLIHNQ